MEEIASLFCLDVGSSPVRCVLTVLSSPIWLPFVGGVYIYTKITEHKTQKQFQKEISRLSNNTSWYEKSNICIWINKQTLFGIVLEIHSDTEGSIIDILNKYWYEGITDNFVFFIVDETNMKQIRQVPQIVASEQTKRHIKIIDLIPNNKRKLNIENRCVKMQHTKYYGLLCKLFTIDYLSTCSLTCSLRCCNQNTIS